MDFVCFSFNKKEEDFDSLNAYNDYLELIETISKFGEQCIQHQIGPFFFFFVCVLGGGGELIFIFAHKQLCNILVKAQIRG